jgi:hypothetical protein
VNIVPTQGIVEVLEVVEVVGHGTGVTGTVAVPPRRCAASVVELPRLCAGSGTPPLRLCAVTVLAGGVPRSPEHDVSDWAAVDVDVGVCNVDPDWVGSEPRPVVPSPVVPRPLVPRAVTPRLFVFGELFAVAVVGLPTLDDADDADAEEFALDVIVAEFGVLTTPELLTELHGTAVLVVPPELPSRPDMLELGARLTPPPSNGDSPVAPESPLVQGAGLAAPAVVAVVLWELSGLWPKSIPSGDVALMPLGLGAPTMPPGLVAPVCAALWPTPSAVMASITAAARKDFIWMTVRREV